MTRTERRRITRAVRRGQVLPTPREATVAVERAIEERHSLRRARSAYVAVAVVAVAGVGVGVVGPFAFLLPRGFLLACVVVALSSYLPLMERNLARAEALNRAAAAGGADTAASPPA